MNFKKTIAKSLVVAMALGMVPVANLQTAKAAPVTKIELNGETGIATATGGAKFWGIAKEAKDGKGAVKIGDKFYKISNIQDYYEAAIDAYSALKGKAGIIAAGEKATPDSEWKVVELPAAETTFKVQYVASTGGVKGFTPAHALGGEFGYLVASVGKKPVEVDLAASAASIQVKLNDGEWKDFSTFFGGAAAANVTGKLKSFGQSGSALSFRIKGGTNTWASKESKLKVAAQPKAPGVKIDVAKDTTTIKAGMEWQVVDKGTEAGNTWKAATEKKGLSMAELGLVATKDQDVLVRTAANAKKTASKVLRITLNKPAEKLTVPGNDGFKATGGAIGAAANPTAILESNLAYDITKGAVLKNVSKTDIEYALVKDGDDASKIKWNTLKASKDPEKKPSKASLKYSATPKANTWSSDKKTKLFVRLAGTKQDKNNVATQSGVSAGAVIALTNVAQAFKFASASTDNATDSTATATAGSTTAAITVATGAAAKITIKANISNTVNPKGGSPRIKATNAPKGVTFKAGKIDPATGNFDIDVVITKSTFKTEVPNATAEFTIKYEGVDSTFKITFAKK